LTAGINYRNFIALLARLWPCSYRSEQPLGVSRQLTSASNEEASLRRRERKRFRDRLGKAARLKKKAETARTENARKARWMTYGSAGYLAYERRRDIPGGTLEIAKRRKRKPGWAIPSGCPGGTKKPRAGRTLEGAGYREGSRKRSRRSRLDRARMGGSDEGFTGAVMFAGSRNFGVSEPGVEPYLNEPG
jgi:hypothetical protein